MSNKQHEGNIFEFVRNTRHEQRLRIEPATGYSGDSILDLLNAGRAEVYGEQLLLRASEQEEGRAVLGKVLVNENLQHPKPWRKLGASKTKDREKLPAATSPAHQCQVGSEAHLRFQADQLRYQAQLLLQQTGADLEAAAKLLAAATVLMHTSGSWNNVEGVWLLATQAALADKRGDVDEAAHLFEQAALTSSAAMGNKHPSTLGCLGNWGQYLVEHGHEVGKGLLHNAVNKLAIAEPVGRNTQEWIDGALEEFSGTLAKADELIADWHAKQAAWRPPVAEAVVDAEEFLVDVDENPAAELSSQDDTVEFVPHPGSIWLDANWAALPQNEWVAADANGLVAHDATNEGLHRQLKDRGCDLANVTIAFVEDAGSALVRQ